MRWIPETKHGEPVPIFIRIGLLIFGWGLILLPIFLGIWLIGSYEIKYSYRFYPGILVGGESVGGMTYDEALNHFKEKADELRKEGLNLRLESSKGIQQINIPMLATGLTSDNYTEYFSIDNWEDNLRQAYQWGHGINILDDIREQSVLIFGNKNFNFPATTQREAVKSLLDNEISGSFETGIPAKFLSTKNDISISEEKTGEIINKEEIINILENKLSSFDSAPAIFKTTIDIPKVTKADLEPFLDFAKSFSKNGSLVFQYQKHEWKIKGPKIANWLTIKKENGKENKINIERSMVENYLADTVAQFIDNPPQNSRFEMRNGKLVEITAGFSGNIINADKAMQDIENKISEAEININNTNNTIYLPIETIQVEPKVTKDTIEKYKIKDLVGKIRTNFTGSTAGREHNIKIGVSAVNGVLIAPGEEFSTVSAIGPVTSKEGYVKELVIKQDKTTKEYGGGLCQVATSIFRLALNAGLPVTERQNHRFVIHYYEPGLDATIYGPHPDFRFVNDTGHYLLLQGRVENKEVIMELYGQKDGRSVKISKPNLYNKIPAPPTKYIQTAELPIGETKCSETPHDGVSASVLYDVNYPNGITKSKIFRSVYQPWQKVCLVGTAL
ncbi:MAG: VanW family protein [Patescibacteria group bacterium]